MVELDPSQRKSWTASQEIFEGMSVRNSASNALDTEHPRCREPSERIQIDETV